MIHYYHEFSYFTFRVYLDPKTLNNWKKDMAEIKWRGWLQRLVNLEVLLFLQRQGQIPTEHVYWTSLFLPGKINFP